MHIWRQFLWKEIHEQKWKLLTLTSIVLCLMMAGFFGQDLDAALFVTLYGYCLAAPVFVAMGVSSGEKSDDSIEFVRSLPAEMWQAGIVRMLVGWTTLILPLLLVTFCMLLSPAPAPGRITQMIDTFASDLSLSRAQAATIVLLIVADCCSTSYAWILLLSGHAKTEFRAAMTGIAVAGGLFLTTIWGLSSLDNLRSATDQFHAPTAVAMALTPAHWYTTLDPLKALGTTYSHLPLSHVLCLLLLILTAAGRYGQRTLLESLAIRIPRITSASPASSQLRPQFQSPRNALLWAQLKQCLPFARITLAVGLVSWLLPEEPRIDILLMMTISFGTLIAIILGTHSFVPDLQPGMHTFWRSRPIAPAQWFWLKYASGLFGVIALFDAPLFLLLLLQSESTSQLSIGFTVLFHTFAYTCGVLTACAVRHPIQAPILTCGAIAVFMLGPNVVHAPQSLAFTQLWRLSGAAGADPFALHLNAILLTAPLIAGAAAFAAWLVKHDISVAQ